MNGVVWMQLIVLDAITDIYLEWDRLHRRHLQWPCLCSWRVNDARHLPRLD